MKSRDGLFFDLFIPKYIKIPMKIDKILVLRNEMKIS